VVQILSTVSRADRTSLNVHKGHAELADEFFQAIGQSHLKDHQRYAYLLNLAAGVKQVKFSGKSELAKAAIAVEGRSDAE
jgi:hypothetical protein